MCVIFFFFNDTATTEIYTLSLHDALPIFGVHDDVDLVRAEAEEPVRLDDFEPLVHQGRRVDGYLRAHVPGRVAHRLLDRKSTRLNSSHANISYAVFCLKKKKQFAS